jgi:DNA primase
LTGDQVAALARAVPLADRGVLVALDADAPGRNAAVRAYWRLIPVTSSLTAVTFPDGADPAALLQAGGRTLLSNAITSDIRPLADLVIDSRMQDWARGRELVFAELQMGALRAASTVIAAMPPEHVGPQAARLCAQFAEHYGWKPQEVTTEIIDAIERHIIGSQAPSAAGEPERVAGSPWAVVMRATAPARPQPEAEGLAAGSSPRLRLVRPRSAGIHAAQR